MSSTRVGRETTPQTDLCTTLLDFHRYTLPVWVRRVARLEYANNAARMAVGDVSFLERATARVLAATAQSARAAASAPAPNQRAACLRVHADLRALAPRLAQLLSANAPQKGRRPQSTRSPASSGAPSARSPAPRRPSPLGGSARPSPSRRSARCTEPFGGRWETLPYGAARPTGGGEMPPRPPRVRAAAEGVGPEERQRLLERVAFFEHVSHARGGADAEEARGIFQKLYGSYLGPRRFAEWMDDLTLRKLRRR